MKLTMKLLGLIFGALMLVNVAYAESPRDQLKQMVEQLQANPSDNALREKIIKLAQGLKPAPAIPEEARRSFVRGNTAFSEAKGQDDYARAAQRYEEALLIAPWWGDPYFNLAKALELRQEYSRAIQSLRLFVLTGPSADDARKAQDYIYALEDKQEKLTKEKSEQETAARAEEAKYRWLLGEWKYRLKVGSGLLLSDGVLQAKKLDNRIELLRVEQTTFPGKRNETTSRIGDPNFSTNFIRATIQKSGEVVWEKWGGEPTEDSCDPGWQPINVNISSDRHAIEFQQTTWFYRECHLRGAGQYYYTLTHE